MATVTSHIILGHEHPNDGGINSAPFGLLQLTEGSRPYWAYAPMKKMDPFSPICKGIYPTLDNTIDDAFLYLSIMQRIIDEPSPTFLNIISTFRSQKSISMLDIPHNIRTILYDECKRFSHLLPKTIIAIFTPDSLISHQTNQLNDYNNSMALLVPKYVRDIDNWTTQPKIYGDLSNN
jgi:hypothetical protein